MNIAAIRFSDIGAQKLRRTLECTTATGFAVGELFTRVFVLTYCNRWLNAEKKLILWKRD